MDIRLIGYDKAARSAIVAVDGHKQRVKARDRGLFVDLCGIQGSGFLIFVGRFNKRSGSITYELASEALRKVKPVRVRSVTLPIPSDCSILSQRGRGIVSVAMAMLDNPSSVSIETD